MNLINQNKDMNEKICSICCSNLENDISHLECNHTFHFNCIYTWFKTNIQRHQYQRFLNCPYCTQQSCLIVPESYDGIALYYFYTKFKRYNCITPNCNNKEYPMNSKLCSKCNEPKYNKNDLYKIFSYLFHFHYLSLHYRKKLLIIIVYYYQLYGHFIDIELQLHFIEKNDNYQQLLLFIDLLYEHCAKLYIQNQDFLEFPNI